MLLPTVAYVGGPGEIGYYAMLRDCYAAVGRSMPVIWPRPSVTIVDPPVARLLSKRGLRDLSLPEGLAKARRETVARADSVGIERLFGEIRGAVDAVYDPAVQRLGGFDAVLGSLAARNRERVRREIGWLERKSWQVARQRSAEVLGQLDRVETRLWPRRGPQERTLCGLGLVAAYGPDAVAALTQVEVGPPYCHYFAYLG
jgi:uncharacterized protein YllA (UPF0747 family)